MLQPRSHTAAQSAVMHRGASSLTSKLYHLFATIINFLLWPLVRLSYFLFPYYETDGVSSNASALATRQFIARLNQSGSSSTSNTGGNNSQGPAQVWDTVGFAHAQQQATQKEQLLLVYLYSPLQPLVQKDTARGSPTVTFCSQLWSRTEMQDLLSLVTPIGMSVHTGPGAHLAQRLHITIFPALVLLEPPPLSDNNNHASSSRQTWKLALTVQGATLMRCDVSLLTRYIQQAMAQHQTHIAVHQQRRQEHLESQLLRQQQDAEYLESLRQDQERERQARQAQEEADQAAAQAARAEEEKQEAAKRALEAAQNTVREPPTSGGTMVRFVLPSGSKVNRRFYNDDTMGVLMAYLKVYFHENEIDIKRVSLSTNFPKKTYSDESVTLEEAGLSPQAVLMVQDLDA
jgi:FAS-associated factor 2